MSKKENYQQEITKTVPEYNAIDIDLDKKFKERKNFNLLEDDAKLSIPSDKDLKFNEMKISDKKYKDNITPSKKEIKLQNTIKSQSFVKIVDEFLEEELEKQIYIYDKLPISERSNVILASSIYLHAKELQKFRKNTQDFHDQLSK